MRMRREVLRILVSKRLRWNVSPPTRFVHAPRGEEKTLAELGRLLLRLVA